MSDSAPGEAPPQHDGGPLAPTQLPAHTTEIGAGERRRELAPAITQLGRYLLEERIGRGGMGEVFRAHDPELDRAVAIKRLMSFSDDDQAQLRLSREGQAIARLSHANVVQVFDVGRDPGTGDMFIAMELVDGTTLRQWLRAKPRSWREIAEVFRQAGEGLLAAHAQGVVHRDFKPENVLVTRMGVAKVVDFGLAKPASDPPRETPTPVAVPARRRRPADAERPVPSDATPGSGRSARSSSAFASDITPVGARLGTPAYMAPEQASGITTPRADQFSFAVALFEAFAGYLPFPGDGPARYAVSVLEGEMLEFPRATPVPTRLQEAIYRALEADPAARHASLAPLLAELRRDPAAIRRRVLAIGGTLGVGAAFALAGAELAKPSDERAAQCERDAEAITTAWNDDVRERVRTAMGEVDAPFAGDTATRAVAALDATSTQWQTLRTRWCVASVDEHAPPAIHAAVGACTDRMLERQRDLVASLLDADVEVLTHALDAIERFGRELSQCEDPRYLARHAELDDALAEDRRAALAVLAQARGRLALGQTAAGLRSLDALVLRSDPAIALEHLLVRGALEQERGNLAQARELLERAAREGLGAERPLLAAEWNSSYGALLYALGESDAMAAPFERAWALRRRALGDDHIETLVALGTLGHRPYAQGDYAAALDAYRAAADRAAAVAPELDVDRMLLEEWVAQALSHTGALAEARERTEALVDKFRRSRGDSHPRTLELLETLATIELRAGDPDRALEHFREALAGRAAIGRGGDPIGRAATLANIGASHAELEQYAEAAAALTEALDVLQQSGLPPTHAHVIAIEANLATIQRNLGHADAAIDTLARVVANMHEAGLDSTSDGIMVRLNYGDALVDAERAPEAIVLLRATVETARAGGDRLLLGRVAKGLARALDAAGEPIAADEAMREAALAFAEQPPDSPWRRDFEAFRRARAGG